MNKKGIIFIVVMVAVVAVMLTTLSSAKKDRAVGQETKTKLEETTTSIIDAHGLEDELKGYKQLEYTEALRIKGDASKEIRDLVEEIPAGSSLPTYYIGKKNDNVIVMYEEPDGTSVIKKSVLEGEKYARSEQRGKMGAEEKKASE